MCLGNQINSKAKCMSPSLQLSHRHEIDGLRAIAVLPVVLYHFGVPGLDGGFVGVDIFFVISGFLIGGILWAELERTDTLRLGHFFMRRVRRLAPAYMSVAFATLIGAWFILLPHDFREFGQELIAATVYLANVHFFNDAGYFDAASDKKLLLHTWSLAVEEQFYLVLPTLMLVLAGVKRWLPNLLIILAFVSFIACLWMMSWSQPAAFFLFPFRAWELLAGVCLAIWAQRSGFEWKIGAWVSWVGLALIAVSVFGFSEGDHFPGAYALVPVLGAVMIIANGQHANPVNAALCTRPFLFFGLISYSLYLWHWPAVTLLKYYRGDAGLTPALIVMLFVVVVGLSWLSLKLIEAPVRKGALPGARLLSGYVVSGVVLLGAAFSFAFSDGWPERFSPESRPYIAATRDFNQDWSRCIWPSDGPWAGEKICPIGPKGDPKVLVWGDSHGRAFKEGLDKMAHERGTPGLLIWRGGCPPLIGVTKEERVSSAAEEAACAAAPDIIERGLAGTPSIDTVLLIGRWAYYETGTGVGRDDHNWIRLNANGAAADFPAAVDHTLERLSAYVSRMFVLRQVPEMPHYSAGNAAQAVAYGRLDTDRIRTGLGRTERAAMEARFAGADQALTRGAAAHAAQIIDLWGDLCDGQSCSAFINGTPVYFDNNHVTNTGAKMLRKRFADVFEEAG